jgi:hypothetical protein
MLYEGAWLAWAAVAALAYMLAMWYWRQQRVADIARKWVVITGCDTGFGHALARRLDALGFNVVATCLTVTGTTHAACSQSLIKALIENKSNTRY